MGFGARLAEKRKEKKLTQTDLGKGLGTDGADASKAVVYGWEKDQHFPKVDQLVLICERLGTSADYLLFGKADAAGLSPEVAAVAAEVQALTAKQRAWVIEQLRLNIIPSAIAVFPANQKEVAPEADRQVGHGNG